MSFEAGQSSSVIDLQLTSSDGASTADIVYYVRLTDVLLSNADVIGCPASIGIHFHIILSFFTRIAHFLALGFIL